MQQGEKMSKRLLGGIIGCKDKIFSWHLIITLIMYSNRSKFFDLFKKSKRSACEQKAATVLPNRTAAA